MHCLALFVAGSCSDYIAGRRRHKERKRGREKHRQRERGRERERETVRERGRGIYKEATQMEADTHKTKVHSHIQKTKQKERDDSDYNEEKEGN